MPTIKKYQQGLKENITGFQNELSKIFPDYISTSNYRKGATTKQGLPSKHGIGEATDYSPNPKVKDFIWNTKEGVSLLNKYNIGFIDETLPENKKYGNAYHFGTDPVAVSKAKQRYNELVGKDENKVITTPLTNFDIPIENSNFASVPNTPQKEETVKEQKTNSEALDKLKEEAFIQEFKSFYPEQQSIAQQEQEVQPLETTDVTGIFNQVSQFVDSPMQQGGKIIKDNLGQLKHPGQVTEIEGNIMATHGYGNIPLFVVPDSGEPKIVYPNTGQHFFKGASKFTEYPLKQNELEFLKTLNRK